MKKLLLSAMAAGCLVAGLLGRKGSLERFDGS